MSVDQPLLLHSLKEFDFIIYDLLQATDARTVVEIGAETGVLSSQLAAWAAERGMRVHVIDPSPTDEVRQMPFRFRNCDVHLAKSLEALPEIGPADFYVIDGDHNYYTVFNELHVIESQRPTGHFYLAMLHDVGWPWARRDLYYSPGDIPVNSIHPHSFEVGVTLNNTGAVRGGFRSEGAYALALQEGGPGNGVLTAVDDFLAAHPGYLFRRIPAIFGLGFIFHEQAPWAAAVTQILRPYHQNVLLERLEYNRLQLYLKVIELQDQMCGVKTGDPDTAKAVSERAHGLARATINAACEKAGTAGTKQQESADWVGEKGCIAGTSVDPVDNPLRDWPPEVVSLLQQADAYFENGDLASGHDLIQRTLAILPDDPELIIMLGNVELRLGDVEAATREFTKATILHPEYAHAHAALAAVLLHLGRAEQAETSARQALALEPANLSALKVLARICLDSERYAEAVQTYVTILRENPDDVETLLLVGNCYAEAGRPEDAKTFYRRVLQLDPGNMVAAENLAIVNCAEPPSGSTTPTAAPVTHPPTREGIPVYTSDSHTEAIRSRERSRPQAGDISVDHGDRRLAVSTAEAPLVSVIVPSTRPNMLRRAVESVLTQTYPYVEIIVVNDGMEDCRDLIRSFGDRGIRYLRHDVNKGLAATRNTGLRSASGDYIAYLDEDYFYYPEHLEVLVNILRDGEHKAAYTDGLRAYQVRENGEWVTQRKELIYSNEFDFDKLLIDNLFPNAIMHHRECVLASGLFDEHPSLRAQEDWELWIRMSIRYPFHHISRITYEYTTRSDRSNMRTQWSGAFLSTFQIIHERYKAYTQNKPHIRVAQENLRAKARGWSYQELEQMTTEQIQQIASLEEVVEAIIDGSILLARDDDQKGARDIIQYLLQRLPGNPELWRCYARLLRAMNQPREALAAIQQAVTLKETPGALSELIHVAEALGQKGHQEKLREYIHHRYPQTVPTKAAPEALQPLNVELPPDWMNAHHAMPGKGNRWDNDLWKRDESLQPVARELEEHPDVYHAVSVDCFDTLVARACPEPVNLFIEVGRRLREAGQMLTDITPEEFRIVRQVAEARARRRSQKERSTVEARLAEIYAELGRLVRDPAMAADVELQVEREWTYINPSVASFLCHVKTLGLRVVILSDTYLSAVQLRTLLEHNELDPGLIDEILTSSDVGGSKAEQRLYAVALQRLGTQPHEVLHIGDNEEADVKAACASGIRGIHYYRHNSHTGAVLLRERMIANSSNHSVSVDSLRVLVQRLCAHLPADEQAYYRDGAFVFGPPLARYADWCVEQAREAGATRLLTCMREGELLSTLIRNAAAAAGVDLDVSPLFVSRHSTSLASLGQVTLEKLASRSVKRRAITVQQLLANFNICPSETKLTPMDLEQPIASGQDLTSLLSRLCQSPWKELIERRSAECRAKLMAYLEPLVRGHAVLAIADLGYQGTIQRRLYEIFCLEGLSVKTVGCYFSTQRAAADLVLEGVDIRSYLGKLGSQHFMAGCFTFHPEILEQTVSAQIGSTEGYEVGPDGRTTPVLGPYCCSPEEQRYREVTQQGILAFQDLWLSMLRPKVPHALTGEIDAYSLAVMHRLFAFPLPGEAQRFGRLHHDDNNGADTWEFICDDGARQVFRERGFDGLIRQNAYWPQGVVALERPEIVGNFFQTWQLLAGM